MRLTRKFDASVSEDALYEGGTNRSRGKRLACVAAAVLCLSAATAAPAYAYGGATVYYNGSLNPSPAPVHVPAVLAVYSSYHFSNGKGINDNISSLKIDRDAFQYETFWVDGHCSGSAASFAAGQSYPTISSKFNDKFSSNAPEYYVTGNGC